MSLEFDSFSWTAYHCVYPSTAQAHLHGYGSQQQLDELRLFCSVYDVYFKVSRMCVGVGVGGATPPMINYVFV